MATEIDLIDFDLYQLEELADFETPPEGTYEWEGVSIKTEQADELKQGESEKTISMVLRFKLLQTLELKKPETDKPLKEPVELSIRLQLNNRTDSFFFRKQESTMRKFTIPVAEAYGVKTSKAVSEKFPGTKGQVTISNRNYKDADGNDKVSWDVKLVSVA